MKIKAVVPRYYEILIEMTVWALAEGNFFQKKIRYCLGVSEFTVSLFITCILAEEIHFESSHLPTFGLPC